MTRNILLLFIFFFSFATADVFSQKLQPGFRKQELLQMLSISARQIDTAYSRNIPAPQRFKRVYQSPVVGLENRWELWLSKDSVAVISIRGTTGNSVSWLENFYAAMVPATGSLTLAPDFTFNYKLADNPKAAVHVGWLIGTAYLSKDIVPKIDSCARAGVKSFLITGHSQGGAIAYLLTSYVGYLQKQGAIPATIRFKTYCTAAPKPGNLYYAYDYEALTAPGWAFNAVNTADWVPETPVSIQTINDFNQTNPFRNARQVIKKQRFPKNIALSYGFSQLDKPTKKALRKNQKYLGTLAAKLVKRHLPGFVPPVYYPSSNYARTGNFIVLPADEAYYKSFPDNDKNVFTHHLFRPYFYLIRKLK